MSRTVAAALIGTVVLAALAAALWWLLATPPTPPTPAETAPATATAETAARPAVDDDVVTGSFELLFPGPGGRLYRERRELAVSSNPRQRAGALVNGLLAGPRGEGLVAPFPAGLTLGSVLLADNGVAYVDLVAPPTVALGSAGSQRELQTVYSLVNTLCENLTEVDRVVLLINGTQPQTLAGHLDLSRPLSTNLELVASAP